MADDDQCLSAYEKLLLLQALIVSRIDKSHLYLSACQLLTCRCRSPLEQGFNETTIGVGKKECRACSRVTKEADRVPCNLGHMFSRLVAGLKALGINVLRPRQRSLMKAAHLAEDSLVARQISLFLLTTTSVTFPFASNFS